MTSKFLPCIHFCWRSLICRSIVQSWPMVRASWSMWQLPMGKWMASCWQDPFCKIQPSRPRLKLDLWRITLCSWCPWCSGKNSWWVFDVLSNTQLMNSSLQQLRLDLSCKNRSRKMRSWTPNLIIDFCISTGCNLLSINTSRGIDWARSESTSEAAESKTCALTGVEGVWKYWAQYVPM